MLSLPNRPATRWAVPLAAIASASPDIDVALCHTPLEFLLLHRGITHSLAAAPLLGLLLTLLVLALWGVATMAGELDPDTAARIDLRNPARVQRVQRCNCVATHFCVPLVTSSTSVFCHPLEE